MYRKSARIATAVLAVLAGAAAATGSAAAGENAPPGATSDRQVQHGSDAPARGPVVKLGRTGGEGTSHPLAVQTYVDPAGKSKLTRTTPTGYTPQQLRGVLGLTGSGAGETVAVVVAYDAPNAAADLDTFSRTFGLPTASFRKITGDGGKHYPRTEPEWALEAALDLQWAHAVAPQAALVLVEARSSSLEDLLTAVDTAARQPGVSVISNSWGHDGEFEGQAAQDHHCASSTAVCVAASGDDGHPGMYPAYNPAVLAVGGTTLDLDPAGAVRSETTWSGSGGGVSTMEALPGYQQGLSRNGIPLPRRTIPDVSYDGDPATGVAVFNTTRVAGESGWFQMGGTSAGTPQWSGVIAVANELRRSKGKTDLVAVRGSARPLHEAVYGAARAGRSSLADILSGSNGTCGAECTAGVGYDATTGLGSPRRGIDQALAASP